MARGRKRKFEGSFGEFKKQQGLPPANRNISPSSAGSGYQAGADPGRGEISNYSPKDQRVGGLNQKEIDFLKSKKVQVYSTELEHGYTWRKLVDLVKEGKLKF